MDCLHSPPNQSNASPHTGGNVVQFPPSHVRRGLVEDLARAAYCELTRRLVLAKAARGELEPELVAYLLDAAGVR